MRRRSFALLVMAALTGLTALPAAAQPPGTQISVLLAAGWNNLAYVGQTTRVSVALQQIAGKYVAIWTWDPAGQRWLGYNPLLASAGDFTELEQNRAYWIRMNSQGEVLMPVPAGQPGLVLVPGWNNFVYSQSERPIAEALAGAAGRYSTVWRWDPARQVWNGFNQAAPMASDFSTLGPRRAYFVHLSPGFSITLANPIVAAVPIPPLGVVAAAASATATPGPGSLASPPPGWPGPGVPITVTPTVPAGAAGSGPRTGNGCYLFQSYQPQTAEVTRAQNRAAFGLLTADPDFKIKDLDTSPESGGGSAPAYIPPTLLKAIGWVESGWRQASFNTNRGANGPTITSTSCAYGLMQLLTGMKIDATPTAKQLKIGNDYLMNIAAGAQLLGEKWNFAPRYTPVVLPRNPRAIENWYYAVWAYHCFGEACERLGIHNNPDDPALKWPRPAYNSPEQLASGSQFTFTDYPYQELVYGVVMHPPKVNGVPLWQPLPVSLPPRGAVGFPEAKPFLSPALTMDPTQPD